MKDLFMQIENCQKCKTIIGYQKFPMESHGNLESIALIVSEAPGKDSIGKNKYWIGTGGKILRECMPCGTELEDLFYLTDIVKCWPNQNSENRKPKDQEINNCSHFLLKEINTIQPQLVLSFGGTSSSFLLNRDVIITKEHGKITQYNSKTKIITLLHPSGIDRFMDRRLYKLQLALLFTKIKNNDLNTIIEIFENKGEINKTTSDDIKPNKALGFTQIPKGSFIIPSIGNSITQNDVNNCQVRITVDFKEYFPSKSTSVLIEYKKDIFEVKFNFRFNKSHILKLGENLSKLINLKAGMRIKMVV